MVIDKNPPAFPLFIPATTEGPETVNGGMTLRDYFAAKAMQGLMGRAWDDKKMNDEELINTWAVSAYGVADAMLKARSK